MASSTFALSQLGGLTQPASATNLHFGVLKHNEIQKRDHVTGSSAGSIDTAHVFINGLPRTNVAAYGRLRLASDSSYGLSQACTITMASWKIHAHRWSVRRMWQIFDVTGSSGGAADPEKNFVWGLPYTYIDIVGVVQGDAGAEFAPLTTVNSGTIATTCDDYGTISGVAKVGAKRLTVPYQTGGPIQYSITAVYSGAVTYTQVDGTNDLLWLYPSTPFAPISGTMTEDIDTSTNIAHKAILHDLTVFADPQNGGEIRMAAQLVFDEAA